LISRRHVFHSEKFVKLVKKVCDRNLTEV